MKNTILIDCPSCQATNTHYPLLSDELCCYYCGQKVPVAPIRPNAPPVGLMPRWLHEEQRVQEIFDAMRRYVAQKQVVPDLWIDELQELFKQKRGGHSG